MKQRRPPQPSGDASRRRANRAFRSRRDPPLSFVAPVLPASDPEVRRALAQERRTWQRHDARLYYLDRVAEVAPGVLRDLEIVGDVGHAASKPCASCCAWWLRSPRFFLRGGGGDVAVGRTRHAVTTGQSGWDYERLANVRGQRWNPPTPTWGSWFADVRRGWAVDQGGDPYWLDERARLVELEAAAQPSPDRRARREVNERAPVLQWARHYGLDAPWALVVVRQTLDLWDRWPAGRGRVWDRNLANTGALIPASGRLPKRPAERTFRPEHFDWTVRRVVLREPSDTIASTVRRIPTEYPAASTVHRAVKTLADYLDLPIPPPRRQK